MICTNLAKGKEWGGHGCVAMGVANAAQSSEAEPNLQLALFFLSMRINSIKAALTFQIVVPCIQRTMP